MDWFSLKISAFLAASNMDTSYLFAVFSESPTPENIIRLLISQQSEIMAVKTMGENFALLVITPKEEFSSQSL